MPRTTPNGAAQHPAMPMTKKTDSLIGAAWTEERKASHRKKLRKRRHELAAARQKAREARQEFPDYAASTLTIRPKSGPLQKLILNDVQKLLHAMAERQRTQTGRVRMLVLKARQPGVSTYVEGRFFWRVTRGQGLRAFILTHEEAASNNLFAMAKRFYEHLPKDTRPKVATLNARELKFAALDSSYRVGTAGTEGLGRSETIQLFHGSEVAHWPHAETHAAGVLQAVPDEDDTEVWLESTASGPNGLFYSMVANSQHARTSGRSIASSCSFSS